MKHYVMLRREFSTTESDDIIIFIHIFIILQVVILNVTVINFLSDVRRRSLRKSKCMHPIL
jgi:hypothetical protein